MATTAEGLDLTAAEVIDAVRAARVAEQRAAVRQLELALVWARLHPCPVGGTPAHWGEVDLHGETVCPLAGQGAPWVAEFAPADLGAALDLSTDAARLLLGDALELAHRLPRLWALVQDLVVPTWRARSIARETRDLSLEAAGFADRLIAATPEKIGSVHAARLVHEARLYFDPDRAAADEAEALARRGVWSRPGATPATTEMWMTLETPDADLFDQSLSRVAGDLRALGDTDPLEVRRARAVGVLADPQYALDLMSGREGAAPTTGSAVANLFVHLTPADLAGGTGAVSIERLGAATTGLLTDWLTRHTATGAKVVLRPVLDLNNQTAVDQHDPPAAMREQVLLRESHCVFPGCRRDSRACDLDHITALRPPRGRRIPGPNPAREPCAVVPHPPPGQDPHRLGLQASRSGWLHLDQPYRPPVPDPTRRPAPTSHHPPSPDHHPAPTPTNLTAPAPRPQPPSGPPACVRQRTPAARAGAA